EHRDPLRCGVPDRHHHGGERHEICPHRGAPSPSGRKPLTGCKLLRLPSAARSPNTPVVTAPSRLPFENWGAWETRISLNRFFSRTWKVEARITVYSPGTRAHRHPPRPRRARIRSAPWTAAGALSPVSPGPP